MFYSETRAAKVCLPFVGHLMRNRKDMNRISFLNRGYAFKGLLAVGRECSEKWSYLDFEIAAYLAVN